MATIDILTTACEEQWKETLPATRNVFGSVEYAHIHETFSNLEARLFVWSNGDTQVVYPFFLRSARLLPFNSGVSTPVWDTVTPDYTGPIVNSLSKSILGQEFASDFANFCQRYGIVAEFAHLHPWQSCTNALVNSSIKNDREIVYVDVTRSENDLWQDSFTYACRKNIRRAQNSEVSIFAAETLTHIHDFHRIYIDTMERNNADKKYFFSVDFFLAFFNQIPNHARFMLAEYQGEVIAGTLYLHDDTNVYSYLGGADYEFQKVRPSNAIIYETIRWANRVGKKRLILGGGYRENDGIFRFKASFSPLRSCFRVYKQVHLPEQYEMLCSAWANHYQTESKPGNFFPAYRSEFLEELI